MELCVKIFWGAVCCISSLGANCYVSGNANLDTLNILDIINGNNGYVGKNIHISAKVGINRTTEPEENMTVPEVLSYYGYPVEKFDVTTEDGYIIEIHRIPHGKGNNSSGNPKKVVFLQHGGFAQSFVWVFNQPQRSLGFILADAGYDVWMGNTRGNIYGLKHTKLTAKDDKFWDFTFHEVGYYDIPAMLDFVLAKTNSKNLTYIGHSQGPTLLFVALTMKPEYNAKINLFIAMGPGYRTKHSSSPLMKALEPWAHNSNDFIKIFGTKAMDMKLFLKVAYELVCADNDSTHICTSIIFMMYGKNPEQFNETRLPVYLTNSPDTTATKNMIHTIQLQASTKFRQYDYGTIENMLRYRSAFPPTYNMRKITCSTKLMWGENDIATVPDDIHLLNKALRHIPAEEYKVNNRNWTHMDFVWGKDAPTEVYKKVIEWIG